MLSQNARLWGKRVIILHAGTEDGFLPGCLLISAKAIKDSSADYHQDMNSDLFETWVSKQLLPALEQRYPGRECVVVQDNAAYHSRLKTRPATKSTKKTDLLAIMEQHGIIVQNPDPATGRAPTNARLLEKIREANLPREYVVDQLIRDAGHSVLRRTIASSTQ